MYCSLCFIVMFHPLPSVFALHQLAEDEQAAGLASATEEASAFTSLDFAIAGIIMNNLVATDNIANETMVRMSYIMNIY